MPDKSMKRKARTSSSCTDTSSDSQCYRYLTWTERPMDTMSFASPEHYSDCFCLMNELRSSKKLCDVTIKVGKEKIPAHKIVLASACPFFYAMFTSGMKEETASVIKVRDISKNIFILLVNFCYTAKITITPVNVWELLPAATLLQINPIINACCVYLEKLLNHDTCIDIAKFAQEYACLDLKEKAIRYLYYNFSTVCTTQSFLSLDSSEICTFVQSDDLIVGCETEVYDAICAWILHDEKTRLEYLHPLFCSVRGHSMPADDIDKRLKYCPLLGQNGNLQVHFQRIYNDLTIARPTLSTIAHERPRKSCIPTVIYLAGGYNRKASEGFNCFDPQDKKWIKLSNLSETKCGLVLCFLRGKIYSVGGRNSNIKGSNDLTIVESYDRLTDRWVIESHIPTHRGRISSAVLDSNLYIVGGSLEQRFIDAVERYNPVTQEWAVLSPLPCPRVGIALAVLDHRLYAIGGYDGRARTNRVDCYHPITDEWSECKPLLKERSGAGVSTYAGRFVYVVGGYDGDNQLTSVERYDASRDIWETITNMSTPRSALGAAILGSKLFVIGGFDGNEFVKSICSYDINSDEWTHETDMSVGLSGVGVTIGPEPLADITTRIATLDINSQIANSKNIFSYQNL